MKRGLESGGSTLVNWKKVDDDAAQLDMQVAEVPCT